MIVPDIERFGEKDKTSGHQNWKDVPAGSALEGLLLPTPPGKDYRLLKVVTRPQSKWPAWETTECPFSTPPASPLSTEARRGQKGRW